MAKIKVRLARIYEFGESELVGKDYDEKCKNAKLKAIFLFEIEKDEFDAIDLVGAEIVDEPYIGYSAGITESELIDFGLKGILDSEESRYFLSLPEAKQEELKAKHKDDIEYYYGKITAEDTNSSEIIQDCCEPLFNELREMLKKPLEIVEQIHE